jgi:hypothetical protein
MNNPVIYWVIGGLLILFFFFLTYKFTKTWRIWHVLFAFLVFAAALALCVVAALSLRTHQMWRSQATQYSRQIIVEKATRDELLYGDPLEAVQSKPSIRSVTAQVQRALINRGRVWRGCTPAQAAADDTVVVNIPVTAAPPADAAAGPAAPVPAPAPAPAAPGAKPEPAPAKPAAPAAPAPLVETNTILHVFVEEELNPPEADLPAGTKIPRYFLGEFTATAATESSVTLRPTRPLNAAEKRAMRLPGRTWAIYETLPVDSHTAFAAHPYQTPDLNRNADEAPLFGVIEAARLDQLLQAPKREGLPSDEVFQQFQQRFQRMVQPYLRDGKRASQDDPPANVWLKVRFKKPHKEEVDTAGDPVGAVVSSQSFFDRGRAEIALLRRGGSVEFKVGDVGVFPQDDGNRLINQLQVCELIEPVYVRTLNDYDYGLRHLHELSVQLEETMFQTLRDKTEVERANALVLEQTKQSQADKVQLTEDLDKTRLEQERMTAYVTTLEGRYAKRREDLSLLYRANAELADELARIDQELTNRINRSSAAAVGNSE